MLAAQRMYGCNVGHQILKMASSWLPFGCFDPSLSSVEASSVGNSDKTGGREGREEKAEKIQNRRGVVPNDNERSLCGRER